MTPKENKNSKEVHEAEGTKDRTIDRKEAIKKTGYIALSAATMILLLNQPANAQSSPANPGSGW